MTSYVNLAKIASETKIETMRMYARNENCDELSLVSLKIGQYVMYENEVGKFPKMAALNVDRQSDFVF